MLDLYDSVLAALDGLTESLCALSLQTLMKDLLKCIHCIVHLLRVNKERMSHITEPAKKLLILAQMQVIEKHNYKRDSNHLQAHELRYAGIICRENSFFERSIHLVAKPLVC